MWKSQPISPYVSPSQKHTPLTKIDGIIQPSGPLDFSKGGVQTEKQARRRSSHTQRSFLKQSSARAHRAAGAEDVGRQLRGVLGLFEPVQAPEGLGAEERARTPGARKSLEKPGEVGREWRESESEL